MFGVSFFRISVLFRSLDSGSGISITSFLKKNVVLFICIMPSGVFKVVFLILWQILLKVYDDTI